MRTVLGQVAAGEAEGEIMNETARKVLQDEKERWINFRIEKEELIHKLMNELEVQREHLQSYDRHITALQEALESD